MWKFADFNITNDTLNRMRADYNASYVAVRVKDPVNRLFTDSESSVRSSKGIVTILDAMRLCDQVDLFGFADPGGSTARYHCMQLCGSNQDSRQRLVCNSRVYAPRWTQFGTRASALVTTVGRSWGANERSARAD